MIANQYAVFREKPDTNLHKIIITNVNVGAIYSANVAHKPFWQEEQQRLTVLIKVWWRNV